MKRHMAALTGSVVVLLTLGLRVGPLPTHAQQAGKVYRIGWLSPTLGTYDAAAPFLEKFRALGWVEGQHFVLEKRFAPAGQLEQLAALAAELVQQHVDIIVTVSTPGAHAAKQATTTIPIVLAGIGDPVGSGLVESLARPGGNITGLTARPTGGLISKQLELLKEAAPRITRVGILGSLVWNTHRLGPLPPAQRDAIISQWQAAAQGIGVTIIPMIVFDPREYADAFATFIQERVEALLVDVTPLNVHHFQDIMAFATAQGVPTIAGWKDFARQGGLLSYFTSWEDLRQRTAVYVDKILKGANPTDLPVEQPVKFDLVVNLKTAQQLGLTMPPSLLILADEVIK